VGIPLIVPDLQPQATKKFSIKPSALCPEQKTGTGGNRETEGSWTDPPTLCPEQNDKEGDFGRVTFFVLPYRRRK
jgi:hypothetical protein